MNKRLNLMYKIFAILFIGALVIVQMPKKSYAAVTDYQKAQVVFTFDDGFQSMYQNAAPILKAAGYKATMYYITGIGDGTYQNGTTDDNQPGMTWAQVQDLQNTYGWEIGSHTVSHPLMSTLTDAQADAELTQSRDALIAHGITPTNFAFPQGDYLNPTLVQSFKYYATSRGFQDVGLETFPYSNTVLHDESLDNQMTLAQAEAFVDQAIANRQTLIFTGHAIGNASDGYEYTWPTADFQSLVDYVKSKNVSVVTVNEAVQKPGANILTNSSFENGMTGWTTDSPAQTVVDTANNGSYNNPTNSVKLTGGTTAAHLFSNLIKVVPGKDYLVDAFVNTLNLTSGEFGFYVDEYDANNNWLSGQNIGAVANGTVGFFDKVIQATSGSTAAFRVQTYLTAGSTGTVYTDNVKVNDMSNASNTPAAAAINGTPAASTSAAPATVNTPTASPSAAPVATQSAATSGANLINNGSFENGLTNWSTDNAANVTLDTTSKGNEGQNSIHFTANSVYSHLFSDITALPDTTSTYTWSTYVNALSGTGEFGFYIDEYDANGNWISGKSIGTITAIFSGTKIFSYIPSSANVKSVRLQFYQTPNSTFDLYIDSIILSK